MMSALSSHPWDTQLPDVPKPVASYVPVVRQGTMVWTSGMLPMRDGHLMFRGAVGDEGLSVEQAQQAARQCVLNALAAIKSEVGSLSAIAKVAKITVFVMSQPGFYQQPVVANGASHALTEVLGEEIGQHARSAVGVSNLPMESPVEVEVIVTLRSEVA